MVVDRSTVCHWTKKIKIGNEEELTCVIKNKVDDW